ncbi:hypothetical protein [Sediminibacterium soli]|uniref:hypothetical protein n=1 Tax=Sediminibacterium soli TaxID=2698829 RepID=UPI001379C640|nr:hypothetical protein [Sediminibacterium soli]NCI46591.1 hypothetical protein [Sediminibacterium soli]
MKHSQTIGILAAIATIAVCFLPWVVIPGKQLVITGMDAAGTNFGKPGLVNSILCVVMIVLFLVPRIWSKRTNVFLAALNLAWCFRNYLLVSTCMMGECPEKKSWLFALLFLGITIQLMALLPKIPLPQKK